MKLEIKNNYFKRNGIVPFKIAVLAEEAGFDEFCDQHFVYGNNDKKIPTGTLNTTIAKGSFYNNSMLKNDWERPYGCFSAPFYSQLIVWLLENNYYPHVFMNEDCTFKPFPSMISINNKEKQKISFGMPLGNSFERYEDALESSVEFCLKDMIKNK